MSSDTNWIQVTVPKDTFCLISDLDKIDRINTNEINSNYETWEVLLSRTLTELGISDAVHITSESKESVHVYFAVQRSDWEFILDVLWSKGIGTVNGTAVGYMPFTMYYGTTGCRTGDGAIEEEDEDDVFATDTGPVINTNDPNFGSLRSSTKKSKGELKNKSSRLSSFKKAQTDFLKSVTSRLTVDQVVSGVKNSSKVTFDFLMYTFFAGCIASCGLLNSSAVDIAAAMCIEPVMSTILALSLGAVLHDVSLVKMGIRNNLIVVFECIVVGFFYGMVVFIWAKEWHPPGEIWPTDEMISRSTWRGVVMGALQASAAGGAVALSLLSNNWTALVGVAIASTFLPHATNCGLLLSYAAHLSWRGFDQPDVTVNVTTSSGTLLVTTKEAFIPLPGYNSTYSWDMRFECLHLSYVSLVNTYVNALCLFLWCTLIFKIKEVAPLGSFEPNSKFFREDMRVYRDHAHVQVNRRTLDDEDRPDGGLVMDASAANKLRDIFAVAADAIAPSDPRVAATLKSQRGLMTQRTISTERKRRGWSIFGQNESANDLPMQILSEWAELVGIDKDELFSSSPEARRRQVETLADLAKEVEGDPSYVSVMKAAKGIPEKNLVRRLTQPTLKLDELNMPGSSRHLEGIDNLAFQEDIQQDIRIRISSSTAQAGASAIDSARVRSQTLNSWNRSSQIPSPLQMPLSPSLLVSEDPSGGGTASENERNSQAITPPLTPSRKRPLPPWLRRSLAQSHHSPYSLWPSLHQREITPLSSTHNVRFRSFNTSTMNVSPRVSSVSNNQWQRTRSTSSMPSKFI